jgi:hypothetical protein
VVSTWASRGTCIHRRAGILWPHSDSCGKVGRMCSQGSGHSCLPLGLGGLLQCGREQGTSWPRTWVHNQAGVGGLCDLTGNVAFLGAESHQPGLFCLSSCLLWSR